ncbi:hypothetical protein [Ascidiaceihabitans sp.]|uniref:hypothetical protein n=1 Tax=Ascidiaceihabitans sp. TaxID=1872644 RepID=UPI00329A4180
MSLIDCKSCGAKISSSAKSSPKYKTGHRQKTGQCKACNTVLDADQIYHYWSTTVNGSSQARQGQRDCPKRGQPNPFDLGTRLATGGATEGIIITVVLIALIAFGITIFNA